MRLINADLLKKNCKCTGGFEDNFKCVSLSELAKVIDNQPTAYDVNRVLGKLHDEMMNSTSSEFDYAMYKAIEIVKGGGIR